MTNNNRPIFTITKFTKEGGGQLTKTISLDADGVMVSDGSACLMSCGSAQNIDLYSPVALSVFIDGLQSSEAVALGRVLTDKVGRDHDDVVKVVTKARLHQPCAGVISRSNDYIAFQKGAPAFMLLDVDFKGMPCGIAEAIDEAGGVLPLISSVLPGFAGASVVTRASTSAGISNSETGKVFDKSGGSHIYVPVTDGSDIPRALEVLFERLWLNGYGWIMLGSAGQLLERSLIDVSVGAPERLVFEGAPVIKPPLVQDQEARAAVYTPGEVIDTSVVLPNLTTAEKAILGSLKARAREGRRAEALLIREDADRRIARKQASISGAPFERVLQNIQQRHNGILMPNHPLVFDDPGIGIVTVADVLQAPQSYLHETLADPLEGIGYGRCKAMVMGKPETGLIIHSFAHGKTIYKLKKDRALVEAVITNSTKETVLSNFISTVAHAVLKREELEYLKDEVSRKACVRLSVVNNALRENESHEWAERRRIQQEAMAADMRIKLDAPAQDAELLATLSPIDEIMCGVAVPEPPFRNIEGDHCRIVERSPVGLHELRAYSEGRDKKNELPAPVEPLIFANDTAGVTMDIEKYIRFEAVQDKKGAFPKTVRLNSVYANAYASWPDSKLPVVRGISTLPLVLPGRTVISSNGLHKDLGLVFRMDASLLGPLSDPDLYTLDRARKAYNYLINKWLADVDTDQEGKAVIVALALSLIERHLLPARPAFFVTAGQRGGGKTTALNMVATAVFGRSAAAANWSSSEEERRKTIFSYLSSGISFLVWDNIPRGESISCPTIEKALTSPELSDRVLGETRTLAVPATTVMAFTGNNITPKGDLASRSLITRLAVSRADPENREFKHPDPIAWTIAMRRPILLALYSILLVEREALLHAKTRFKDWWRLIGHPTELVSGVDFNELFRQNDEIDEEATGATRLFNGLRNLFKEQKFTAVDLTKVINAEHDPVVAEPGKQVSDTFKDKATLEAFGIELRAALEEAAAGKRFPPGELTPQRVGKKLQALVGRTVFCGDDTLTLRHDPRREPVAYWLKVVAE